MKKKRSSTTSRRWLTLLSPHANHQDEKTKQIKTDQNINQSIKYSDSVYLQVFYISIFHKMYHIHIHFTCKKHVFEPPAARCPTPPALTVKSTLVSTASRRRASRSSSSRRVHAARVTESIWRNCTPQKVRRSNCSIENINQNQPVENTKQ